MTGNRFGKKVTGGARAGRSLIGRSQKLLQRRNLKLLIRFHQLTEVQRRRFDDVVRILSTEEFFISEQRIWWIVKRHLDILDKIKAGEVVELSIDTDDKDQLKLFDETNEKK
jgi:hypothetical protein